MGQWQCTLPALERKIRVQFFQFTTHVRPILFECRQYRSIFGCIVHSATAVELHVQRQQGTLQGMWNEGLKLEAQLV